MSDSVNVNPAEDTDATPLEPENHTILDVFRETQTIVEEWTFLHLLIGIPQADFTRISKDHQKVKDRQMAFIKHWLNSGNASWAILVAALRDSVVGLGALADKIAKKHPNPEMKEKKQESKQLKKDSTKFDSSVVAATEPETVDFCDKGGEEEEEEDEEEEEEEEKEDIVFTGLEKLIINVLSGEISGLDLQGTDDFSSSICTYERAKTSYVKQRFYRCRDCFSGGNEGVCCSCAKTCHKGHEVVYDGTYPAFCDCGLQKCRITCQIGSKCTFDCFGTQGQCQRWYQCLTCWGGKSQFGTCDVCAKECHKGHNLVNTGMSSGGAVCDCGLNKHKSDVCTFHVTKNRGIVQPFYICLICFPSGNKGCCFQCMKNCHAGHPIQSLGVIKAFCDCALQDCQISKP